MNSAPILVEPYGDLPGGSEARIYTLVNKQGLRAKVTDFGAILVSMEVPDKLGQMADVTIGYDALNGWVADQSYLGASVGRFGNRIRDGKFKLGGKEYTLATNNSPGGIPCHLHGGVKGFNKVLWTAEILNAQSITFIYHSKDGEEGYPGNLEVRITYTLNDQDELIWQATATTDAETPVNIVHHSYWNLTGDPTSTAIDHSLTLHADRFLPTHAGLIPTGEVCSVAGTPMDFTHPHLISERIDADYEPLRFAGGYDHCWVLTEKGNHLRQAALLKDPTSGRSMEVFTNQPGIQFYSGNFLDGTPGKGGVPQGRRSGLCFETQGFPDAPNHPHFPSCILRPGEIYDHMLVHRFSHQ